MNSSDFSVVIQGPIMGKPGDVYEHQKTLQCLESIKHVLPDAEIILSTWKGSEYSHLFYDKIVLNDDPGAISYNDFELKNVFNNNNRQIVSTYNGLKEASRKYSIKMRGDFRFESTSFFSLIDKFTEVNKYRFFKHRILVPTYVSRDPERIPLLYHISDLFQVGYTEDLLDLWNIPLQPEPQTTRTYPYNPFFVNSPFRDYKYSNRFACEQYIWYAFAKKRGLDLSIKYMSNIPVSKIAPSLVSIIDNFIIASPQQLGIVVPSSILQKFNKNYFYTFNKWQELYNKFSVQRSTFHIVIHSILILLCSLKWSVINMKFFFKQRIKVILDYKRLFFLRIIK
jgi:hypothetical protein